MKYMDIRQILNSRIKQIESLEEVKKDAEYGIYLSNQIIENQIANEWSFIFETYLFAILCEYHPDIFDNKYFEYVTAEYDKLNKLQYWKEVTKHIRVMHANELYKDIIKNNK